MSEAMQRQTGQTPAWLLFSGVAIGVVGASVKKHAESVGELVAALATRTYSSDVAVAAALGQAGLALLVAGVFVALAGVVVIALAANVHRELTPEAVFPKFLDDHMSRKSSRFGRS
jgi:hypothetical protein